MQSIYLGLFLILVVLLLFWSLRNDRVSKISEQKGLFSMRIPDSEKEEADKPVSPAYFEETAPPEQGEEEDDGQNRT